MAVTVAGPTVSIEDRLAFEESFVNSLSGLNDQLNSGGFEFPTIGGPQISSGNTLWDNCRWYLISNFRQLLSQVYAEHGIVQTLVDQPVDDAFRAGFELKSSQLDANDIEQIIAYMETPQGEETPLGTPLHNIMQAIKWGRLYGGGAVIPFTNQNPSKPLNIAAIGPNDPLEFRGCDMWELFFAVQNTAASVQVGGALGANMGEFYDYYGSQVHKSHVFRIIGKEAPSFLRPRLRGWGMSELERLIRSLSQYLKNQDLIFQLLDEAKVDVFGIEGFNNSLLNSAGTDQIARRIQLSNRSKSFNSALVMDAKDKYEQKQITFAGLAEVLLQIRQGIAADLKMPMTKLFGISSAGFNSGEDDIENYNGMIDGEIRSKNKWIVVKVAKIICQKLFGFYPEDLTAEFNPLRILNAKEEEEVKDSQWARTSAAYTLGLATDKETKQGINKHSLLGVELDESTDAQPPLEMGGDSGEDEPKAKPASGSAQDNKPRARGSK